jgi:hypothetical protein
VQRDERRDGGREIAGDALREHRLDQQGVRLITHLEDGLGGQVTETSYLKKRAYGRRRGREARDVSQNHSNHMSHQSTAMSVCKKLQETCF